MKDLIKGDVRKTKSENLSFDFDAVIKLIQQTDPDIAKRVSYPIFMEDKDKGIKYKVGEVIDNDKARLIQELIDTHL